MFILFAQNQDPAQFTEGVKPPVYFIGSERSQSLAFADQYLKEYDGGLYDRQMVKFAFCKFVFSKRITSTAIVATETFSEMKPMLENLEKENVTLYCVEGIEKQEDYDLLSVQEKCTDLSISKCTDW